MPQRDFIQTYLEVFENTEPHQTFQLWSALNAISIALQRKVHFVLGEGLTFYPNLFCVFVAPPGERKGMAVNQALPLIDRLRDSVHIAPSSCTKEKLAILLGEAETSEAFPGKAPFIHSSLSVISEEFTVFLKHKNAELVDWLCDWWDCPEHWSDSTKTAGTAEAKNVFVGLWGATTPTALKAALPPTAIGGGLSSRTIFLYEPKKGKSVPIPFITSEQETAKRWLFKDIQRIHGLNGRMKATSEFFDLYFDWYMENDAHPPFKEQNLLAYNSRRPVHLVKLCMLSSVSRSSSLLIEDIDFERALKVLKQAELKMPWVFNGIGSYDKASTLTNIMMKIQDEKRVKFSTLMNYFYQDIDSDELMKMLETLERMEFCSLKINLSNSGQTEVKYNKDFKGAE